MSSWKDINLNQINTEELEGYLYQLNEQIKYMFNNLTPDDNFSKAALEKYLENEKEVTYLKLDFGNFKVEMKDFEKETESKIEQTTEAIKLKVSKGEVSNEISVETGQVIIRGNRLVVESNNFSLDASGNAFFRGNISGSNITGSRIMCKGGEFEADEDSVYIGGFYTFHTRRGTYLGSYAQDVGMGDNDFFNFWTGWDGRDINTSNPETVLNSYGCVLTPTDAYAQELYLNHSIFEGSRKYWGVGETISDIYDRLDALDAAVF